MSDYKVLNTSKGTRYMKDGKFVKADDMPEFIKEGHDPTTDCVVCGNGGNHKRMILGMATCLCDNHYYSATYGAVAGILKKKGFIDVHEDTSERS